MVEADRRVGITTTIPVEAVFAAGLVPVDLNNRFITSADPGRLVEQAEYSGFPRNVCAWVKGCYAAARDLGIRRVVAVARGDCSNTHALAEILETEGVEVVEFSFPYGRDRTELEPELEKLCARLGTTRAAAEEMRGRLEPLRGLMREIDRLTFEDGRVSGEENHLWLVNCSDFRGDAETYAREAAVFLEAARVRPRRAGGIRLGLIGIPPICANLYAVVEEFGGTVVFNEMQRQFSMPYDAGDLAEQYQRYTYPYDIFFRLDDAERELTQRRVRGVIHYVQSFCFRSIQDRLVRERLRVPVLTLECDRPGPLDARSRTRVEAFLEMLSSR